MPTELIIPNNFALFTARFQRDELAGKYQSFHLGALQGTDQDPEEMLDQFVAAWTVTGSLNEGQPTSVFCVNLNVRYRIGGLLYSVDRPSPWIAGGGSGNLLSPAVTTCIKTHTAQAGRKFRGRFQMPWASETDVDMGGNIDSGVVAAYTAAAEVFRLGLISDATQLGGAYLLHSSGATAPTLITSMTCRSTVGTVRRRQTVGS